MLSNEQEQALVDACNQFIKSDDQARVHVPATPTTTANNSTPAVQSAPTLFDLLNTENIEPSSVDIEAVEEQLFNHPDPYDLDETERVDDALRRDHTVVRSSDTFAITEFIKLEEPALKELILNVDSQGPGAQSSVEKKGAEKEMTGTPGDWSIDSFFMGEAAED
ncbi:hypothetical protein CPB84DRAFT_1747771 [Gymnopilus junonius]|uniref:Uncharacterized protein n=1 Tax=Gymnopilus junonius TaxID=109634 RepID=A0A9P5NMT1_GYMJU|nr:hypothetical protein CPB84DRAFT_1747771 [Gymnopilus junonius]